MVVLFVCYYHAFALFGGVVSSAGLYVVCLFLVLRQT